MSKIPSNLKMMTLDSSGTLFREDALGIVYPSVHDEESGWLLRIAIANPLWAIPLNSEIDQIAREQGVSLNQGEAGVIHMLPNDVRSKVGFCLGSTVLSVYLDLKIASDGEFEFLDFGQRMIAPVVVKTTTSVDTILTQPGDPHHRVWKEFFDCAEALSHWLDIDCGRKNSSPSDWMLSVFMTVFNMVMTEKMHALGFPLLSSKKFRGGELIPYSRGDFEKHCGLPLDPSLYCGFLVARRRIGTLTTLTPEIPDSENEASAYAGFTSPARKYSDLVNFRQLLAACVGQPLPYSAADLAEMAPVLSARIQQRAGNKQGHDSFLFQQVLGEELVEIYVHGEFGRFSHLLLDVFARRIALSDQVCEILYRRFALLSPQTRMVDGELAGMKFKPKEAVSRRVWQQVCQRQDALSEGRRSLAADDLPFSPARIPAQPVQAVCVFSLPPREVLVNVLGTVTHCLPPYGGSTPRPEVGKGRRVISAAERETFPTESKIRRDPYNVLRQYVADKWGKSQLSFSSRQKHFEETGKQWVVTCSCRGRVFTGVDRQKNVAQIKAAFYACMYVFDLSP